MVSESYYLKVFGMYDIKMQPARTKKLGLQRK